MTVLLVAGALPDSLPWFVFAVPILGAILLLALPLGAPASTAAPVEERVPRDLPEPVRQAPELQEEATAEVDLPIPPPAEAAPEPVAVEERGTFQHYRTALEPTARSLLRWPGSGLAGAAATGLLLFFLATGQGIVESLASAAGLAAAIGLAGLLEGR